MSTLSHIAPVVLVPHHIGPDGWHAAVAVVADALDAQPNLPLTIRLPGAALSYVGRADARLWERLAAHRPGFLAGGWSDPVLADLPPAAAIEQLRQEKAAMDSAGVEPIGLWVGDGWERYMCNFAVEAGLRLVFVEGSLVDGDPDRPGPHDRAGATVVIVPVRDAPPAAAAGDGMGAVKVRPGDLIETAARYPGRLVAPDVYLADHIPGPPITPAVTVPGRSREAEIYYRKLLALAHDAAGPTSEAALALQSREFTTGSGRGEDAHRRLLDARRATERSRWRGDAWVRVEERDWDGDGVEEVAIETPAASLVLDPADGRILTWDDKVGRWPITAVSPVALGHVARTVTAAGGEAEVGRLWLERRHQGRAEARLTLTDGTGNEYRLALTERSLTIRMTGAAPAPVRLGPELPVLLDAATTRLRVDGGEWLPAVEPVAASGHRFRLTDGEHTMLVTSPRPCDLFVSPLPGRGLVVWPHWPSAGAIEHEVEFQTRA